MIESNRLPGSTWFFLLLWVLEMKIAQMEEIVAHARVIDESKIDNSKVLILSKVKVKNIVNAKSRIWRSLASVLSGSRLGSSRDRMTHESATHKKLKVSATQ